MNRKIILTLLFLTQLPAAFPHDDGRFLEASLQTAYPFTITAYSTQHGLPQSQVIDIVERKDGSLIVATANGIVEYDGQEFSEFIRDKAYRNHMCRKLLWDELHDQLFALQGKGGLYRFHPRLERIADANAAALWRDKLYFIDASGGLHVSNCRKLNFRKLLQTGIRRAYAMQVAYPYLYVGSAGGLHRIDLRNHAVRKLLGGDKISGFRVNPFDHNLYAHSVRSAYRVGKNGATPIYTLDDPNTVELRDIAFIAADRYYIATTNGLVYCAPGVRRRYSQEHLPSPYLGCLYYNSHEDFLLAGTGEKGLLKLQHKDCYTLLPDREMSGVSLGSIIMADNRDILLSANPGNVLRIRDTNIDLYRTTVHHISSLAFIEGKVFAGCWGQGVFILKNREQAGRITPKQLPDGEVHAVFQDSRGTFWIGTGKGIARGKRPQDVRPHLQGIVKGIIICFFETSRGDICIGSSTGAYILSPDGRLIRTLSYADGFAGKEVRSFFEDAEKKLWIGSYNGGLYCYDKGRLTSINRKKNCLLPEDVFTLARDEFGYLNITSNFGLWKVHEKDLEAFYRGRLDRLVPYYFGQEAGILNTEFNGGFQNNYAVSPQRRYYFPTIEGVVISHPEYLPFRRLEPHIRSVRVNDSLYEGEPVFERSVQTVGFRFSCARFSDKYNLHFQHKLVGGDGPEEWTVPHRDRTVSFRMLPPGNYTLVVRAVDASNDRHPKELRYSFTIRSHFYETLWFRAMLAAVLLSLILAAIRLRVKQVRRKTQHANAIANTILELKLKAIQAKMHPHFIFNALNNIQYLIVLKKLDEAESTLTNFSGLLRKFLQQSDQSFVTVEDEFEMLRLYITIERYRLSNRFDCQIHCEERLGQYFLPSMLLQPLVENALIHGLLHSDKEQRLHVSATSDGGQLVIAIEDNGIGRQASSEVNRNRHEHVSHGIQLVMEKIRIVGEKYRITVDLQLFDIRDGQHTGTRVVFRLPLLHTDPSVD